MKKAAIIQSNYIPWKGYFDIIHDVDVFVFLDDVQFTKNDWRNRNQIKTPNGVKWLSIPVGQHIHRNINEVELTDSRWQKKHWDALKNSYGKAPFFRLYEDFFEHIYLESTWSSLSEINQFLIAHISTNFLQCKTEFIDSRQVAAEGKKQDKLIGILKKLGAGSYLSGPAAMSYLNEEGFAQEGIKLVYKNYEGYPAYPQSYPPFAHGVSIVDLLFHTGPDASYYIWGWRENGVKE
ncbi:WbqC family protein [Falsibacillus pallidus]|uniref:WbqC-like protein n=1 Tax=Falsibacillus pallidus TaxID=493781 RepID=A0A370G8M0_9BACI|nr:WbqC family protein [Falsibacillus pallidus]RDI40107.1 WbqC-like protein [Falsibacillus pallidus]